MPELWFLLPGDPATLTGGYIYDKRIVAGLREAGWTVHLERLSASFPEPDQEALEGARAALARIPDGAAVVVDGLAFGAMPQVAEAEADRLKLIALVHHPLAEETGLSPAKQALLHGQERAALATARRVIVTSAATARGLAAYGVAPERIGVVPPGCDPAPLATGSDGPGLALVCVASLTPRKGHAVLFEALAGLLDRPWRLTCVGSRDRDPETANELEAMIARRGLSERVVLTGELGGAALDRRYHDADLAVLASFHEGYGMVLAEALARGLPVVSTTAGAIPGTVPETAGILVPPGDTAALAAALARVMDDAALRRRLAAGAREAREALPTWPEGAARFAAELEAIP